jgi:hypothetical protein
MPSDRQPQSPHLAGSVVPHPRFLRVGLGLGLFLPASLFYFVLSFPALVWTAFRGAVGFSPVAQPFLAVFLGCKHMREQCHDISSARCAWGSEARDLLLFSLNRKL